MYLFILRKILLTYYVIIVYACLDYRRRWNLWH